MSLRRQMVVIILVCWLASGTLWPYLLWDGILISSLGQGAKQSLSEQFQVNLQMCGTGWTVRGGSVPAGHLMILPSRMPGKPMNWTGGIRHFIRKPRRF